jgi:predicted nuclease of predicted toxin-antitoxin system
LKLRNFGLLTDENIDPEVVSFLRQAGFDVLDTTESGWQGVADVDLIRAAVAQRRVVVTHDSDFGSLAILQGEPIVGIVYLRPAHFHAAFTIQTIEAVLKADRDIATPFVLVAKRKGNRVTIRVREIQS